VLILALDTSSPGGSLAALNDQRVIGSVSSWTDEPYSSRMFRHLDFLLREISLRLDQFDLFAVTAGPGSFTGLRVGLSAVKGWAEVYSRPIAAISVLEAVAAQSHASASLFVPVLDARRGQVYFGFYRKRGGPGLSLEAEGDACVMAPEEFLNTIETRVGKNEECAIVTPTPEALLDSGRLATVRESSRTMVPEQISGVLAPVVGRLGYFRAQRAELVGALDLDANYVRRTDAELHWKGT
jgi:tRNA threonylcarbamoyladenosine biosynthesis protein TsaB